MLVCLEAKVTKERLEYRVRQDHLVYKEHQD